MRQVVIKYPAENCNLKDWHHQVARALNGHLKHVDYNGAGETRLSVSISDQLTYSEVFDRVHRVKNDTHIEIINPNQGRGA